MKTGQPIIKLKIALAIAWLDSRVDVISEINQNKSH
jgi:hypothetical protein